MSIYDKADLIDHLGESRLPTLDIFDYHRGLTAKRVRRPGLGEKGEWAAFVYEVRIRHFKQGKIQRLTPKTPLCSRGTISTDTDRELSRNRFNSTLIAKTVGAAD